MQDHQPQPNFERQSDPLLDAWDALPRGPAIFIATLDGDRPTRGTWVSLDQPERYFFGELDLLLSEPADNQQNRQWLILDQIGIGEAMLPERLSLAALHHVLAGRHGERG